MIAIRDPAIFAPTDMGERSDNEMRRSNVLIKTKQSEASLGGQERLVIDNFQSYLVKNTVEKNFVKNYTREIHEALLFASLISNYESRYCHVHFIALSSCIVLRRAA